MHQTIDNQLSTTKPTLLYVRKNYFSNAFHPPRNLHKHEFLEITLIIDGYNDYLFHDSHYYLSPGSIIVCNRDVYHSENFRSPHGLFINLTITNLNIPGLPQDHLISDLDQPAFYSIAHFSEIHDLAKVIFNVWKSKRAHHKEMTEHLLNAFLYRILELKSEKRLSPELVEKSDDNKSKLIVNYINKYYYEDLTLDSISKDFGVSQSYLSHVFKSETGFSPIQYLTMLRMGEAQTLLTATDFTMTEIAGMIGYNTSTNFYIMFKKHIGISPKQYRKKYKSFQE